jgi:hypothetical protein
LCDEVNFNLACRWFGRLGLEDAVPERSTFSKNRHGRFRDSNAFRHVFETELRRCMDEGLVGGEGFAIDASTIKVDASRAHARGIAGAAIDVPAFGPAPPLQMRLYSEMTCDCRTALSIRRFRFRNNPI